MVPSGLGGNEGLWRYDGSGWQQQAQVTGYASVIHQSGDGTLWMGGQDGPRHGLWHYEDSQSSLVEWTMVRSGSDWQLAPINIGLTGQQVNAIHESINDTLWIGSYGGLWRDDGSGWDSVAGFSDQVRAIHESSDGMLWVSVGHEVLHSQFILERRGRQVATIEPKLGSKRHRVAWCKSL